jgi:transposase
MWTEENRQRYNRDKLRYPSDLTEDEWLVLKPLIPPAKRGGRKRDVDIREVLNGAMYVLSTGCQWRALPKDLPPKSTVHGYFSGYQGPKFREALKKVLPDLTVEIVKRSDMAKGFELLPRRWVVERTFAWLNRCRRLAKDFENLHRSALAYIRLASIRLMVRKLCNSNGSFSDRL